MAAADFSRRYSESGMSTVVLMLEILPYLWQTDRLILIVNWPARKASQRRCNKASSILRQVLVL
jgi:hypothetical protein